MNIPLIAEVMKNPSNLSRIVNPSFDICMAALVLDGMCVKYIDPSHFTRREYHSMCEAAVRQNSRALTKIKRERFSSIKWENLKLFAVMQNGFALRWINEQTPEICLEAVKNNPKALSYVDKSLCSSRCYNLLKKAADLKIKENQKEEKEKRSLRSSRKVKQKQTINLLNAKIQTEALCLNAVKQDGLQIRYVWKQTRKLCLAAFNQNPDAIDFIRDSSLITIDDLFSDACKHIGSMAEGIGDMVFYYTDKKANKIPSKLKTEGKYNNSERYYAACNEVIEENNCNIKFINPRYLTDNQYKELCFKAIKEDIKIFIYINKAKISNEIYFNICCETLKFIKPCLLKTFLIVINTTRLTNEQYYSIIQYISKAFPKEITYLFSDIDAKALTNEQYFSICRNLIHKKLWFFDMMNPEFLSNNQYSELCFYTVKKNYFYINNVEKKYFSRNDYLELCRMAIRKKGDILDFLNIHSKKDFQELHQLALKKGSGLKYIDKQNYKQCLSIISINGSELSFIRPNQFTNEQYFNLCKTAVENNGKSLFSVDDEELEQKQYQELCEISVKSFHGNFRFVNNEKIPSYLYHTWCKKALEENPCLIDEIPYSNRYYSYCLKAVKKNGNVLGDVKYLRLTKEEYTAVCKAAVKQNKEAEQYVVK